MLFLEGDTVRLALFVGSQYNTTYHSLSVNTLIIDGPEQDQTQGRSFLSRNRAPFSCQGYLVIYYKKKSLYT